MREIIGFISLSIIWTAAALFAPSPAHALKCERNFAPYAIEASWNQPHETNDPINVDNFYETVYENYEGTVRRELIQLLHAIDGELERDRTLHATIRDRIGGTIVGTFRIFDGSINSWRIGVGDNTGNHVPLPFERMNSRRNLTWNFADALEAAKNLSPLEMMETIKKGMEPFFRFEIAKMLLESIRKKGFVHVFEVGKLSLHGTPEQRTLAREAIEDHWSENVLSKFPNGLFVAHVASAAHARHYKQLWGFELALDYDVIGSPDKEMVIWAPGWLIDQHIRKNQNRLRPGEKMGVPSDDVIAPLMPATLYQIARSIVMTRMESPLPQ